MKLSLTWKLRRLAPTTVIFVPRFSMRLWMSDWDDKLRALLRTKKLIHVPIVKKIHRLEAPNMRF